MNVQRALSRPLAGAIALALSGALAIATAQTPPPPSTQPATPVQQQAPVQQQMPPSAATPPVQPQAARQATAEFYPGTKSSATYPIQNGTLTVNAGMPAQVQSYGPPPAFKSLDSNHDGRIGEIEAQAYPPLDNDFLYASSGGQTISRGQYEKWVSGRH